MQPVLNEQVWLSIAELTAAFGILNEIRDGEGKLPPDEFNQKHGDCESWVAEAVADLIDAVKSGDKPA
jgi:hypothetical protein